jgi:hypothetical protein
VNMLVWIKQKHELLADERIGALPVCPTYSGSDRVLTFLEKCLNFDPPGKLLE